MGALLLGTIQDPNIQTDGFKTEIKEEVDRDEVIGTSNFSEDTEQIEETQLEYEEDDSTDQHTVSMAYIPIMVWSPLFLVAATQGLSPSSLLVGILSLILAKILDSKKA